MSNTIEDGTGSGYRAKVDSNNRLFAQVINEPMADHHGEVGKKFNINTGDVTLTDANKTSMLYVKNNEDKDLVVTALIYNLGNTDGSGDAKIDVLYNPLSGDIITNANDVEMKANVNAGSSINLAADAYKGATSEGVTSGGAITISTRTNNPEGRIFLSLGAIVFPKGTSMVIEYTPPVGNTSQIVQFAAACYVQTLEV